MGIIKDEIDILYGASNKLTQAATPVEQLEAVSDYARDSGATSGILFYTEVDAQGWPTGLEVVAEWTAGKGQPVGLGQRFHIPDYEFSQNWIRHQSRPTFVHDTLLSDLVDPTSRAFFARYQMRGAALLPLNVKGRWAGLIMFTWSVPYLFDERDQRIFTTLIQQTAPVVESVRLFEQTQKRAADLEIAKNEIDILYAASNKLTQSSNPAELLVAASSYARSIGATYGALTYVYSERPDPAQQGELVAEWAAADERLQGIGKRFALCYGLESRFPRGEGGSEGPESPLLIEDTSAVSSPQDDRGLCAVHQDYASLAILPLNSRGRWIATLSFSWSQPCQFTERDRRIFKALIQQAASVVDAMRLFEQSQLRAARAEQLLKVNTALSRATNEAEIVAAVAQYSDRHHPSSLALSYLRVDEQGEPVETTTMAVWKGGRLSPHDPRLNVTYRLADFPVARNWITQPDRALLVEDTLHDPRVDDRTRQAMVALGTRSMAAIPLRSAGQWQGLISLQWTEPHQFTEEEKYIYSELVQTLPYVVATRRAYLAEEEARHESEFLYWAGEAINAATTTEEIVQAVAHLSQGWQAIFLMIWENYDYDTASYLEILASIQDEEGNWPLVGTRFRREAFPIAGRMPRDELWVIEDVREDPRVDEMTAMTWESMSTRALIAMPLTINDRWMAGISFHSTMPRQYTARDRRLAAGIGDLVLAAIERIRLQAETEAAHQQARTLAEVNAALSQAEDEDSILAAVALLAEKYGVLLSTLAYLDVDEAGQPRRVEVVALRSSEQGSLAPHTLPDTSFSPDRFPVLRLGFEGTGEPIFIENVQRDPLTEAGESRQYARAMGRAAAILVPLRAGDQWQAIMSFTWRSPQIFAADIRSAFVAIQPAAAAVVTSRRAYLAEEKARRETELRAHELETVASMSAAAASILNEEDLLRAVTELARASFPHYHLSMYLLDARQETLVHVSGAATPEEQADLPPALRISLHSERSLVARAGRQRQGIIVNDIANTPDYHLMPFLEGAGSEMAVPMAVADRLVGVLDVQCSEVDRFSQADIRVMATLADLIAVAVQNARSYRRAQELAALEERTRLARELHDSVSQALYGIALGAHTARTLLTRDPSRLGEPIEYILSLAEAGLTEMRALIFELRPESLENEGLMTALSKQAASLQARHGIAVETDLCEEPPLPLDLKEALYRIAREALHNTVKHAHATQVQLRVQVLPDRVALTVRDNGVGFDPSGSFPGHLGLQSMRERTQRLNGTLDISSAPGSGTQIFLTIPLPGAGEDLAG